MEHAEPSLDQWRTLYDLAAKVYALAPWEYMEETDLFGVTDPVSGETNFVSVMGGLGEHLAVALYLGRQGLRGFWELAQQPSTSDPALLLETPQLQLSFEDREETTPADRATIKELGLKFRGRQAWPLFRSFRPGFLPWRLEADEARVLATALSQLLEVAPRFHNSQEFRKDLSRFRFLVREAREGTETPIWGDVTRTISIPKAPEIRVDLPRELTDRVRALGQTIPRIEAGLDVVPGSIGAKGERPQVAYNLMAVEPKSGFILGVDVLGVESTIEAMYGSIPRRFLSILLSSGLRPLVVDVSSARLASVLQPGLGMLKCKVRLRPYLPQYQRAVDSMLSFLRR